jgi:hypothetical protein
MKTMVAKYRVKWLLARAERVFFVYGMRRSGNHACIRWLANALEAEPVVLREGQIPDNFYTSNSGNTVFLNNITDITGWAYIRLLNRHREELRRARFVIISVEDQDSSYRDKWRIPRRSEEISVRRGTLNTMASRYQSLNNRSQAGRNSGGHAMDARFYAVLKSIMSEKKGSIWEFELWCSDREWRRAFLQRFGLNRDVAPEMSVEGEGSSFSGIQVRPSTDQLTRRFTAVEPRRSWIAFIQNAAREHPDVFRKDELDAILATRGNHEDIGRQDVATHRSGESVQHPDLANPDQLIC